MTTTIELSPGIREHIDSALERALEDAIAPGVAVVLADRSGVVYQRAAGLAMAGTETPLSIDSVFEIGSIGKSFTAIMVLQLVREGRLDLHRPVTEYLPWLEIPSSYEPITLHHLLTHTAGIGSGHDHVPDARAEVWAQRNSRVFATPNAHFYYSNLGYKIIGLVLERELGKPYAELVQERILDPRGMADSFGAITHDLRPRLAPGHVARFDDRPWVPQHGAVPATWLETATADGCIATTPYDLSRYAGHLLDLALGNDSTVLTAAELATMRLPHQGETPAPSYGYGLGTYPHPAGLIRFGHNGGMVGWVTAMLIDPEHELTAVVLGNGGIRGDVVAHYVLDAVIADRTGKEMPETPSSNGQIVRDASDYTGTWVSTTQNIDISINNDSLSMHAGGEAIALRRHPLTQDTFAVLDPAWERFPLEFVREEAETAPGPVTTLLHGGERFHRDQSPEDQSVPDEWSGLTGHYRSYNPWQANFRIVVRSGQLTMIDPEGHSSVLTPDGSGYRYGASPDIQSEWIAFDAFIDGRAMIARSDVGEEFVRVFTP